MAKKASSSHAPSSIEDFLDFKPPAPWMSPVSGEVLLDALHETIQTYLIADDCYVTAMVLWIAHTYCYKQFHCSPLLLINAPMASSNSPTCGHPKFPQARPSGL